MHVPVGRRHKEADGSFSGECRFCHKPITSWGKDGGWYLADGFNVSKLRDSTGGRYIYVIDVIDDFIVARYPIDHLATPAALRAYKQELRVAHGLDQPGSTLELRDSNQGAKLHI